MDAPRTFHLHMISDATGETLVAVGQGRAAQYSQVRAPSSTSIRWCAPKSSSSGCSKDIEATPGIVLYTIVDQTLASRSSSAANGWACLAFRCWSRAAGVRILSRHAVDAARSAASMCSMPNISAASRRSISPWCMTTASCLRISTMPISCSIGISRTSKTPTSIYLANRGYQDRQHAARARRAAAAEARAAPTPLIVGLVASAERISQVRQNRVLGTAASDARRPMSTARRSPRRSPRRRQLCARHGWPVIDVTRRSIEETAAAIVAL